MSELTTRQSNEMAQRTPAQELIARVRSDEFKDQVAMVLPENVPASRFVRGTVTALMANPDLASLDTETLFVALLKSAQDGLLPDGRESAIVGYKGKAQYLPMVGGIRRIAAEHGWTIRTAVVRAADEFDYELGMETKLTHRPAVGDRGDLAFAYAVATHRDGRKEVAVMDAADITKVRKVSRASEKGPWVDWPERMWEKSVAHRIFKQLSLDPGDKRVASIIDAESVGPQAATEMLYGPSGAAVGQVREIAQESSTAGSAPQAPAASEGPVDDSQQAAADIQPETQSSGSAAAPGVQASFPIPDDVVDRWGQVQVQDGWTVARTCANEAGQGWVRSVLAGGSDGTVNAGVREALLEYCRQRHPDLLPEESGS